MRRNATRTGPGMARSPATHRRTVRASTSRAAAAATCDNPRAAIAALNSSADNDAILTQRQTGGSQHRAQAVHCLINGEGVGQAAVSAEKRQALRPISAAANEANCVGGKGGDFNGLAHAQQIGPTALAVKQKMQAKP